MSIQTIKAIQLSHLENELQDIAWKIKRATNIINSPAWSHSAKEQRKEQLTRLLARKKVIEEQIIEGTLLGE